MPYDGVSKICLRISMFITQKLIKYRKTSIIVSEILGKYWECQHNFLSWHLYRRPDIGFIKCFWNSILKCSIGKDELCVLMSKLKNLGRHPFDQKMHLLYSAVPKVYFIGKRTLCTYLKMRFILQIYPATF